MQTIVDFYLFFGALFAIIIAAGQILQKKKTGMIYIYAASFFGLGIWLFQIDLCASGLWPEHVYLKVAVMPVTFMVPPLMALRYRWIVLGSHRPSRAHPLLFIPAALVLVCVLVVAGGQGVRPETLITKSVLSPEFAGLPLREQLLYLLIPLPKLYLALVMIPALAPLAVLWRRQRGFTVSTVVRGGFIFAFLITFSNLLAMFGDLFSRELLRFSVIMANTTMIVLYLVTQRHPDYDRLLKSDARKAQYARSRIAGLDVERIIERLHEIMEDEKAFADEELKLGDIASELDISVHQLSQILNERLHKNFNSFVNEFRVAEAKRLLVEEPDRSILSIGIAAGFNSNTTFCMVFARQAGVSPREYRKRNLR